MLLTPDQVAAGLAKVPGWEHKGAAITRTYRLPSFADAIAFVTRLAFEAEAHDHHPDLLVSYRNVTVTWSTHSAGGITQKDLDGAASTDRVRAGIAPAK
jgi:4a-hydroxytetrahydrobiopterin dehydratase